MKQIYILVPKGEAILGSIEGPHKLFSGANDYLVSTGSPPLFELSLVGLSKTPHCYEGLFSVQPARAITDAQGADLIIIPALKDQLEYTVELNTAFLPWIRAQHNNGAEVASLCLGAFLLAATGLLNGKKCATHWTAASEFRVLYPEVQLVDDKIITDEHGIYTSGGAYSFLNLIIYIIEKYAGREVANFCTKVYEIDVERHSQLPFTIFRGQKEHGDGPVRQAQEFIELHFHEKIMVEDLATLLSVSRRSLERRFKKATTSTIVDYIQRVKIEAAKTRLESSNDNINEVMYLVGYADSKAFRSTFKKITGMLPLDYRNKYRTRRN